MENKKEQKENTAANPKGDRLRKEEDDSAKHPVEEQTKKKGNSANGKADFENPDDDPA